MLAGIEKRFDHLRLGVDVYEKRFVQLDGIVRRTVNDVVEHHSITHGNARGVEIYVNRLGANVNWWLSYSLGRSEWSSSETTYSRDYDRLHALSLSQTYQIGSNWDIGATWSWHSGSPYTTQDWRKDDEFGGWTMSEGRPNGQRLPQYQRVDVRVRRHFRFDGWRMSVYLEGLNLTNHDNVMFYSWGFRRQEGGLVPERIARTGVPGLPSIGLEIRF